MRILGVDPGLETIGVGVIDVDGDGKPDLVHFGWIHTSREKKTGLRLRNIYNQTISLIKEQKPEIICIEQLFFYNNAKTAMQVAEAIGIIRLAANDAKIDTVDYAPLKVKAVVAENGRAKKDEMKKVVRKMLSFRTPKKKKTHFDDAADALAVAICHARLTFNQKGGEANNG